MVRRSVEEQLDAVKNAGSVLPDPLSTTTNAG